MTLNFIWSGGITSGALGISMILHPGPLCPRVVVLVRVLSMSQIALFNDLTVCKQMSDCYSNESLVLHSNNENYFRHHHHHHHAISTDIPDPFSPPFPIVHCFRQVFRTTSRIGTDLLYVGSSWSYCLCSSMWKGPQEYVTKNYFTGWKQISSGLFKMLPTNYFVTNI